MKWLDNLPFKYHILISLLFVALLPLLLCSFLMVRMYDMTLRRQANIESERQLTEIQSRIGILFQSCETACINLCEDGAASNVMIDNTTVDIQKDIYVSLYQAVQDVSTYVKFSLYDAGGKLKFSTDNNPSTTSLPTYWGLLRKASNSSSMVYYGYDSVLEKDSDALMHTAYSLESPSGARMGYVVADFTSTSFERLLDGLYSSKSSLIFLDSNYNLIYSSEDFDADFITMLRNQIFHNNPLLDESGTHTQCYWVKEPLSGYYILLLNSSVISSSARQTMQTISLLAAIICLVLCVIISLYLSQSISHPISDLAAAMKKVKHGNLSIRIHTKRKDELGQLTDNFNQMTRDLEDYLKRSVQRQKDLNETRLKLYQTQLNPHFLYNTLDTIKWTAKIHNISDIASLAENLAFILRKSIAGDPFVTLHEELDTIDSYIGIQQIRFSGRFLYEKEVPDLLENCLIPKLILQPLVENSILHGLADRENGYICIFANQVGENLRISVTDDGCGIDNDMLQWLNSPEPEKQSGHLGLYNIVHILKLYYGKEYGLSAATVPDGGTTITVMLPIRYAPIKD